MVRRGVPLAARPLVKVESEGIKDGGGKGEAKLVGDEMESDGGVCRMGVFIRSSVEGSVIQSAERRGGGGEDRADGGVLEPGDAVAVFVREKDEGGVGGVGVEAGCDGPSESFVEVLWRGAVEDPCVGPNGTIPAGVSAVNVGGEVRGGGGVCGEACGHASLPGGVGGAEGMDKPVGCGCVVVCFVSSFNGVEGVQDSRKEL